MDKCIQTGQTSNLIIQIEVVFSLSTSPNTKTNLGIIKGPSKHFKET
jgi:hypothetical protein